MNVACGACPAKYVIPDEKVRGRKVRIPCKHCGASIIIDGTAAVSEAVNPPSGGLISTEAPAKPQALPVQVEKPKPPGTIASNGPVAAQSASNATPIAPKQAVRPQRAIRQTIIGVAAPANAPESPQARAAPIRRPTPIYVRSPEVTAQGGPVSSEHPPVGATGKMRSLRRTMVGGLDTDEPAADNSTTDTAASSKSGVPPVASPAVKPRSRDIKHTIIGGLEAPVGSAPGAEEPRRRPIPKQDTPPGTWMAVLPDGKTLRITETELPRALSKIYVTGETPFWRTGMPDWVPLNKIPELSRFQNQTSAKPQPVAPSVSVPTKSVSRAPAASAPKTQPSQPAPVPSFSRPPTAARVPVPAGLTPKRTDNSERGATPSLSARLGTPFTTSAAQVSRGPASVSARSSSPTLELVEVDNDDEVEGLVSAQADNAASNPNGIHQLQRLAASVSSAPKGPDFNATAQGFASTPVVKLGPSSSADPTGDAKEDLHDSNSVGHVQVTRPQSVQSSFEAQTSSEAAPSIARRRPSKIFRVAIVLILLLACSVTSLVTRQPRPVYAYLHARGWDQMIEVISKKAIDPALTRVKRLLGR